MYVNQFSDQVPSVTSRSKTGLFLKSLLIFFLCILSLGAWSLASPVASSPDDGFHLSSIWCSGDGYAGMCEPGSDGQHRQVASALLDAPTCYAFQPKVDAGCQLSSGILQDFSLTESSTGNFAGGYPPVYYSFMHLFTSEDIASSVLLMRFVNILIFSLLAISLWIVSPSATRATQRLTWVVTLVPLGLFLIASNNPSSWAITGIGISALSLMAFFQTAPESHLAKRLTIIALYAIATFMAAGSRGDSAAYVLVTAAVITLANVPLWKKNISLLLLPVIGSIVGSLFFLSSGHAGVAENGFGDNAESPTTNPVAILAYNVVRIPDLIIGGFAGNGWGLGWLDTKMPESVWVVTFTVFISVLMIAWQKMPKFTSLALTASSLTVIGIPLYVLQRSELTVGQVVQPRYIYPLIIVTAVIALSSQSNFDNFGSRYWRWFVSCGVSLAGAIALYVNMDRYIHGLEKNVGFNLNAQIGWWWVGLPIQPMAVLIIGAVSLTTLVFILVRPWSRQTEIESEALVT